MGRVPGKLSLDAVVLCLLAVSRLGYGNAPNRDPLPRGILAQGASHHLRLIQASVPAPLASFTPPPLASAATSARPTRDAGPVLQRSLRARGASGLRREATAQEVAFTLAEVLYPVTNDLRE